MKNNLEVLTIVGCEPLCQNSYLVISPEATILVDCGASIADVEKIYTKHAHNAKTPKIDAIFLTHTHFDHCDKLEEFEKAYAMPIFAAKGSTKLISLPSHNASPIMQQNLVYQPKRLHEILSENEIVINDLHILPLFTPGHTSCSMCYKIGPYIFTGDTKFYLGVGRTDLPSGNAADLKKSLEKLSKIPADLYYPGHGVPFKKL